MSRPAQATATAASTYTVQTRLLTRLYKLSLAQSRGGVGSSKVRDAVHLLMANEKVQEHDSSLAADVEQSHRGAAFQLIDLLPHVEMKDLLEAL